MDPLNLPLRDLHLPDAIGLWPLAPGWWLLLALVLLAIGLLVNAYRKRHRQSAARRFALKRLELLARSYAENGDAVGLGIEVSELLRRTMLAYAPRSDVAGLTGEAWLEWLDRDLDRSHFVEGDGRPLIEWPYRSKGTEVDRSDVAAFVDAVRLRLETPVGGTS